MPIQSIITLVYGCLDDRSSGPRFSPLSLFGLTGCILAVGAVGAVGTVLMADAALAQADPLSYPEFHLDSHPEFYPEFHQPSYQDSHPKWDSPLLVAQQVLDGLPPPPPIPDLEAPDAVTVPQGSGPNNQTAQPQEDEAGELYMVYVNGDSPLLLEQVKQVAPTATIQPYDGQQVILAGLFDRSTRANEQVEQLDQRGIEADVVSVSSVVLAPNNRQANSSNEPNLTELDELPPADSGIPSVNVSADRPSLSVVSVPAPVEATTRTTTARPGRFSPSGATSSGATSSGATNNPSDNSSAYYVVIPGAEGTVAAMREQVILLGATPDAVAQRDRPLGPHLLIGPFVDQSAATRWNRFFQDLGMDARVYYKR